jgi:hypothetical protein
MAYQNAVKIIINCKIVSYGDGHKSWANTYRISIVLIPCIYGHVIAENIGIRPYDTINYRIRGYVQVLNKRITV